MVLTFLLYCTLTSSTHVDMLLLYNDLPTLFAGLVGVGIRLSYHWHLVALVWLLGMFVW